MNKWLDAAKTIRAVMDKAGTMLDDASASTVVELYPHLQRNGELVQAGTRINWKGQLKRAAVDLWDTEENDPDHAPALWEDVNYRDGYRLIPDVITAGLAFAKDEIGWWKEQKYRSLIAANVYTPEQYPAGWELMSE